MHRGRRLVDTPDGAKNACGRARKSFVCGFHGWTYGLDGACTHIREQDDWKGVLTPQNTHLAPVQVDTWGGWLFVNMDPDCEPLADYLFPAAKILDPFGLENMRYKWRKWLNFDCNWKVAMEAFNETYHVFTTHPEFNKFGEFKGWAKAQGKHSNIGYDAPKGMDETKSKIRLGTGDPRISTAEMQVYTMEETNATTTQTLVNAAKRLVDELPEGTPADKVLEHWLASARRDDEARGVIWPTIPADILGQSGTAWQIFPNFQIGQGLTSALCYSARPDPSYDPNKCIFEVAVFELYPERPRAADGVAVHPGGRPELAVGAAAGLLEHGRRAAGHEIGRLPWHQAQPVPRAQHRQPCTTSCPSTWAPANHRSSMSDSTSDDFDPRHLRTDARRPTTSTSTRCGRSTRTSATKRLRPGRREAVSGAQGRVRGVLRGRPVHAGRRARDPIVEDIDVVVLGGGFAGLLAGAYLKKAGVEGVRVIEMAGDFGGVWYWNRFPGIQCDNDAYCYIPLLEELDFMPSKKFADGAEIFEHCRNIGKHFGLYDGALFSTQVRELRWDESTRALADQHQPRRRHPGPVRRHGPRLVQPPETARHPGHQGLQGAHLPLRALGLRLHRRRCERRPRQAGGQARRARRHRRDRHSVGSAPGPRCQAPLRVPADAVVGGRAHQHARPIPTGPRRCSRAGRRSASATSTTGRRSSAWCSASRIWCATSGPSSAAT